MISIGKCSFRAFLCFGLILAVVLLGSFSLAREVAVIKVEHRWAAELVPIVKTMLSADGTVTVSKRVNSLVIVDTPEAIERVQAYLDRFDRPVEQVRIHVRFHTVGEDRNSEVSARGRISNDNVSVAIGGKKKDGVDISLEDREGRHKSDSEFFVVAMSGSPAYIRAGKEIPYHQNSAFFRRYTPGGGTITWQTVESGFEVTPTLAGDNAYLKIVPRIAYDDRKDGVIRFFGAQTELTVPLGRWVEIGGTTDQKNEIIREIISLSRTGGNSSTSMSLMVERP
jgi:type II secretory pathway component GspD/PulD (secretin)